jgi:hypothetical protein
VGIKLWHLALDGDVSNNHKQLVYV